MRVRAEVASTDESGTRIGGAAPGYGEKAGVEIREKGEGTATEQGEAAAVNSLDSAASITPPKTAEGAAGGAVVEGQDEGPDSAPCRAIGAAFHEEAIHWEAGCTAAGPLRAAVVEAAAAVSSPKETGTKDGAAPAAGGLDTTVAGIDAAKLWRVQVGGLRQEG